MVNVIFVIGLIFVVVGITIGISCIFESKNVLIKFRYLNDVGGTYNGWMMRSYKFDKSKCIDKMMKDISEIRNADERLMIDEITIV